MGRLPFGDLYEFSSQEVQQLLHNKFVVILGDSIQRTSYKDLVYFLQSDRLPSIKELIDPKTTGLNDHLVEGGEKNNLTTYKEVRQYRTDHHLVRFYFLTRVYTNYVESILEDFKAGPMPDLLILNSCLWDLNRYCRNAKGPPLQVAFRMYRENLQTLFQKLRVMLPTSCLVIWNTTMPIGPVVTGAYLLKQGNVQMKNLATHVDILKANFEGATMACCFHFDVLDLNFCFRFLQNHRAFDGVHWDNWVHRYMTKLLLTHTARSWGVKLQKGYLQNGIPWNGNADPYLWAQYQPNPSFHDNTIPNSGFVDFRDDWELQAYPEEQQYGSFHGSANYELNRGQAVPYHPPVPNEAWRFLPCGEPLDCEVAETQYGGFHGPADYALDGRQAIPCPFPVGQEPDEGWTFSFPSHVDYVPNGRLAHPPLPLPQRSPRGFRGRHGNERVMRRPHFGVKHYRPYFQPYRGARGHPRFRGPHPQGLLAPVPWLSRP